MNVTLMSYTPDALNLLLRTKNTRLKFDSDPAEWSEAKKKEHLEYMLNTIKSSWEFSDYVFLIEGVTRAFTHQLVRTRTGSYAQESQRVVDVRGVEVISPGMMVSEDAEIWQDAIEVMQDSYGRLIDNGMPVHYARGLLPTNISTNIIAKFNLRTLHDTAKLRLCTRTQGEYQNVFRLMRERVLEVHPWAEPFIQVHCVSMGTCAFPSYGKKECRYYDDRMDLTELKREVALRFWSDKDIQQAAPKVKDGLAQ